MGWKATLCLLCMSAILSSYPPWFSPWTDWCCWSGVYSFSEHVCSPEFYLLGCALPSIFILSFYKVGVCFPLAGDPGAWLQHLACYNVGLVDNQPITNQSISDTINSSNAIFTKWMHLPGQNPHRNSKMPFVEGDGLLITTLEKQRTPRAEMQGDGTKETERHEDWFLQREEEVSQCFGIEQS